jgi:hypothetical protein
MGQRYDRRKKSLYTAHMCSIFPPCPGLDSRRRANGVYRTDAGVASRIRNWPRRTFPWQSNPFLMAFIL